MRYNIRLLLLSFQKVKLNMCLLFYRDSIVYFAALTASTVDVAVVVIFFFIILWVKFSTFRISRCAKKRRCFDCIYIWCWCVNIFDFYAPIEIQIFPSESRFAFIIFAFMKRKKLGNVPSIPIIIIFSFFSFTIRESKWNDNKIKIVSISWFAERELYLSRALQTCIFF